MTEPVDSNEQRTLRDWMRELAKRPRPNRQVLILTCVVCGRTFTAHSRRRRYCSNACTAKVWRRNHPNYAAHRRARRHAKRQATDGAAPRDREGPA